MNKSLDGNRLAVFKTNLGWMAILSRHETLQRLTFGHVSAAKAALAMLVDGGQTDWHLTASARDGAGWHRRLVADIEAYARGETIDFSKVAVDEREWSPFRRRVLLACRRIPYAQTRTYAELAVEAGSPHAARAVGRVMATNPLPIVIPCHRVVGTGGDLRGYSATGGLATKQRLLDVEAAGVSHGRFLSAVRRIKREAAVAAG